LRYSAGSVQSVLSQTTATALTKFLPLAAVD
jgi:hypothetical protein